MKTQKKNTWVPLDERGYKKSYLTRLVEEDESNNEIKTYCLRSTEMPSPQHVDEEGSMRDLSS